MTQITKNWGGGGKGGGGRPTPQTATFHEDWPSEKTAVYQV